MKICLIDGYGIVFRAYFSIPKLFCPAGKNVSAVYGFCNIVLKIIENRKFDFIAIALDAGKKTFRHDMFHDYKANRTDTHDDLISQFPLIMEAASALGIPTVEKEGFEADDIIATLAKSAENYGYNVEIITVDKDIAQLINDNISIYDPIKNIEISSKDVVEKFSVTPEQLVDFFALIGDSSDNVPGVYGIGPKTASKLLNEYGTLDLLYKNIDKINPPRIQKLIKENEQNAYLSKKLVTLVHDVSINIIPNELLINRNDELLANFLKKYGFQSIAKRLGINDLSVINIKQSLKNSSDFSNISQEIEKDGVAYIYINENVFYIASKNSEFFYQDGNKVDFLHFTKCILESDFIKKIFIDAKPIIKECIKNNIKINAIESIDIMWYLSSPIQGEYSIQTLLDSSGLDDNISLGKKIELLYQNALLNIFSKKSVYIYQEIEKPLIYLLCRMEILGISIDQSYLINLSNDFTLLIKELESKIYKIAGEEFNIGSPKQVGNILFDKLSIAKGKRSKKSGEYSTDHEILEKLSDCGHEIAGLLLEWRQFTKLLNTYTYGLQKSIENGKIHSSFEMKATSTGRLSSKNPNLQNIPIRTPEGAKIRNAFIASNGNKLIVADYSQIELRILAHIANIEALKKAFFSNCDIHTKTASQIFGIKEELISKELRRKAKAINFGIIYGITAFGLAKNVGITEGEASNYIKEYFKMYPGIKEYMDTSIKEANEHGFVRSIFGRKCFITNISSGNFITRSAAQRAAINAPIQSSAADIIKIAMLKIPQEISKYMCLQVHDELLFDVPADKCGIYEQMIKHSMENAVKISVPLNVDIRVSNSWS